MSEQEGGEWSVSYPGDWFGGEIAPINEMAEKPIRKLWRTNILPLPGLEPWFVGRPPLAYTLQSLSYNGFHSHSVKKLVGKVITWGPLNFPVTSQRYTTSCSNCPLQVSPNYGWKCLNVVSAWDCRVVVGKWRIGKDGKEVEWPNLDSVPEPAYGEWGDPWNNFIRRFGLSHDQNWTLVWCKARILGVGI
jgi:hypothetical protein